MKYDLIIIGGGAAAFAAATKASDVGAKTVMINSGLPLGGTCVNVGCVPSKVLLEIASEFYSPQHPRFRAVSMGQPPAFDFETAMREKDELVAALRESNYKRVAEGLGIPVIEGRARFISPYQVETDGQTLEADKFIIATGSRARILPFKGVDKVRYITNREALSLSRLPRSMIVIGAGPLGLEFAQMYARFGTKVTVLEKEKQILPLAEEEYMQRYNVCACRTIEIAQVPKAMAIKETRGKVKMAINPKTQAVAGVHIVAPMAADLIHEAALAVKFKLTIDDIVDTVHVFPTMSEAIKRVAQSFRRNISTMSCCVE